MQRIKSWLDSELKNVCHVNCLNMKERQILHYAGRLEVRLRALVLIYYILNINDLLRNHSLRFKQLYILHISKALQTYF